MAPRSCAHEVTTRFASHDEVAVVEIETNDAWARDYVPTFVKDSESEELVAIDWYYNAWGEKYPPFAADQQVAERVANFLEIKHLAGGMCFEGGAIEISENATLLTTESCALNQNRNAGLSKRDIETILSRRLGCNHVVWLPGDIDGKPAIAGDDTDGHIDQLARFVDNDIIVHAWVDPSDPRHEALAANAAQLQDQLPDSQLVPLMLPEEYVFEGRTIPASYCNFLITNRSVIVPQFGFPEDKKALRVLEQMFPERKVVPLSSRHLSV